VADLSRTRLCDSAGFSVLVRAHRRALADGGGLSLVIRTGGPVARALDLTGVGRFVPTFTSTRASTPMEQPGSKALRYLRCGSCARLIAYLRRSYQRSSKPHGSGAALYMASK
jgi:hypothetical protein